MEPHRSFSNSIVKRYSGEDTKGGAFGKITQCLSFLYKRYNYNVIMKSYAIVQASGKQFWIEENRFYDFDKLPLDLEIVLSLIKFY